MKKSLSNRSLFLLETHPKFGLSLSWNKLITRVTTHYIRWSTLLRWFLDLQIDVFTRKVTVRHTSGMLRKNKSQYTLQEAPPWRISEEYSPYNKLVSKETTENFVQLGDKYASSSISWQLERPMSICSSSFGHWWGHWCWPLMELKTSLSFFIPSS